MKRRNPPALAVWLLSHLGVSADNEPLAGDLLEEFRSGRTVGWYWRQTLMAIVSAFVQRVSELRLELQILIIGWGAQSGVLLALRWYRVAFDLRGIVLGIVGVVAIMLMCYAWMEITARALIKRDDLSEMAFSEQLRRTVFPRVIAVFWFVAFMLSNDALILFLRIAAMLEKWFPFLVMGPEVRLGFPLLFSVTTCWLCWFVVKILISSPDSVLRVRRR